MKKKLAIVVFGLSILITIFSGIKLNQAYSTIPIIYYDGKANEFTSFNINGKDLFENLKDLMPGDIREQEILLKLENIKNDTKIFLKIDENKESELLEKIKIQIYVDNTQLTQSEEYIKLGNFIKDNEIKIKVTVEVPKEIGNEFEDLKYKMDWELLVQQENNNVIEPPYTYDDSNIIMYIIICIISMILMIYSFRKICINCQKK